MNPDDELDLDDPIEDAYESFFETCWEIAEEDGTDVFDVVEWGIEDGCLDVYLDDIEM